MPERLSLRVEEALDRAHLRAAEVIEFAADLVQAEHAELEVVREAAQDRRLLVVRRVGKRAGEAVALPALLDVVDQVVLTRRGAQETEHLRVDARPEQREVADVL